MKRIILIQNIVLVILLVFSLGSLTLGCLALYNFNVNNSPTTYTPTVTVARVIQIVQPQTEIVQNQLQFPTSPLTITFDTPFTNIPITNFTAYETLTYSPCNVYPVSISNTATSFSVDCTTIQNLFGWPVDYGNNITNIQSGNYSISAVLDPADATYKPAVLLYQEIGTLRTLSYYLSRDIYGISWYNKVTLATLSSSPPDYWVESLSLTTLYTGQPAVAYPRLTNMLDIVWMVGNDGQWSSSAVNIIIPRASPATASHYLKVMVMNTNFPVIAFVSLGTNTNIGILTANNPSGTTIANWTLTLSANCAATISLGFSAMIYNENNDTSLQQIACAFACDVGPYSNLYYLQATSADWDSGEIILVATGSSTFDIVVGAITINTIEIGTTIYPMVGTTYQNTNQYFRFFVASNITGTVWSTEVELTTDPYVVVSHLSTTTLPNGLVACVLYNQQQNINTNLSYTVIDGNNLSTAPTLIPFSKHKSLGTSMSIQYLANTGRVCVVYNSTEALDSLGPTRTIGAMFASAPEANLDFNVNVQVNLLATGLLAV